MVRPGARIWAFASLLLICAVPYDAAVAESRTVATRAVTQTSNPFAAFIDEASERFSVPVNWIGSVITIESAGDVHARSPKGAMGLMQIMPATWAELRERYKFGNEPYDPRDNILAGTAYLRELLDRYGSPGVFAAYNAGPVRYEEHLAGGPLPDETRAYVAKLTIRLGIELPPNWTTGPQLSAAATMFVARSDLTKARDRSPVRVPSSGATTAISVHEVSRMVPRSIGVFVPRWDAGAPQ
ncbi:lytic transglycosylase domain-containing protein [Bradyrhizobium sp. NC92]|uniref:lytic transglycosylase domain-containing protein n=1 Tax=Bradyrhizobium sp. (strain NC92) TaxID=55395 RepID=UPI0021AAE7DE|nr:lytic transglycosylase domain-containing protein [Bradyrhizobium sp. NC92]UWU70601.1 lytic transglycosylase domain-containing protein [Bradyrhizobium sp. NC92]